jgi:NagD protein
MSVPNLEANVLCDMDGVLIKDNALIPGAAEFIAQLSLSGRSFLIVTNNSLFSPKELQVRLSSMGLHVEEGHFWTSTLAAARFAADQRPEGSAFVIGENCLHEAVQAAGYRKDQDSPDFVILGETWEYSFSDFATATRLVKAGSRFIATNPEASDRTSQGWLPGCGAMAALVQAASGVAPFFIGKPNPLMLHEALRTLDATSQDTVFIGDRMDTDILAGIQAGPKTILVLSGVATREDADRFPFRPGRIVNSVADLVSEC